MPVSPTYPGVYIEELPSGVHTLTGVATSITAFIGYTTRGPTDKAVHIFSYADFVRAFGDLDVECPVSYCVKQFFQNGGSEAYVIRVAKGAVGASVILRSDTANVLEVTAKGAGTWGNRLRIDVDYDTADPSNLFNLRVTEFVDRDGQLVPGREETFRNLSMNSYAAGYVEDTVNAGSQGLIEVKRLAAVTGSGTSQSGSLAATDIALVDATHNRIGVALDGGAPFEITIGTPPTPTPSTPPTPGPDLDAQILAIAGDIVTQIGIAKGANAVNTPPSTVAAAGTPLVGSFTISSKASERSSIRFFDAGSNNAAKILKLGAANGGVEIDAASLFRPQSTGTTIAAVLPTPAIAAGDITIQVKRGSSNTAIGAVTLALWTTVASQPATLDDLAQRINDTLVTAVNNPTTAQALKESLSGATVKRIGNRIRILSNAGDPGVSFDVSATPSTPTTMFPTVATIRNVARYALGSGATALGQVQGVMGDNGAKPGSTELAGHEVDKSGIYALEDVDLFNILVMPEATDEGANINVVTEAIAYCQRRRAFMIIDTPKGVTDVDQARTWISGTAGPLRSRNAAIYFPHIRESDPMMNNVVRTFPAAGVIAGLYARTDADRGVWKAPAGTSANLAGVTGLSYTMNDRENGTLNPLGLNCLRTFPVYGTVSWGARTARGADALTDEYKYVPVRRLALFLEESLYRGTQWVVFEPNDEPLWAQIRLNLGAFMHTLFAQGAFQGQTPREAYFVKCDKETTTQNDIDLGRVNIVVGFAPLKPAEFVIIQIQQIARGLQV